MEGVGTGEPGRVEILGTQAVCGGPVRDERALPAGLHEHADPSRPGAGDAEGADPDPVRPHRRDERAARRVPPDGADERRPRAEASEPAGSGRGRSALAEQRTARHVRAPLERAGGRQDHVQDEIAEHHDARRLRGHGSSIARRPGAALLGAVGRARYLATR